MSLAHATTRVRVRVLLQPAPARPLYDARRCGHVMKRDAGAQARAIGIDGPGGPGASCGPAGARAICNVTGVCMHVHIHRKESVALTFSAPLLRAVGRISSGRPFFNLPSSRFFPHTAHFIFIASIRARRELGRPSQQLQQTLSRFHASCSTTCGQCLCEASTNSDKSYQCALHVAGNG